MKYFILSDNIDTKIGMRLSGIDGVVVHDTREFQKAFDAAVSDKDIAILLITQKLASLDPARIEKQKMTSQTPLIVQIPDRHGSIKSDNYILNYLKDAIGIKVR